MNVMAVRRGHRGPIVTWGHRGCNGFSCYWLFDPGPLGHKDQLAATTRQVSPIERLLQFGFLTNANISCWQPMAVCHTYNAHTQSTQSSQLHLPEGKSTTPDFCITLAVCRLHLRPLRSHMLSPGSILMQCTKPLPSWCLPPFQASTKQSTLQEQDQGMKESGKSTGEWTNWPGNGMSGGLQTKLSATRTMWVDRMSGARPSTNGSGVKSANAAGCHSASPSPYSVGEMWCLG